MSELNSRIDSLSPAKRAILEQRLKTKQAGEQPIPVRSSTANCVLSSGQQRLWFLDQLSPGSASYNRPTHFRLSGPLDIPALTASLNKIVARHRVLRTTFKPADFRQTKHETAVTQEPVCVIAANLVIQLPVTDLSGANSAEQTTQIQRLATSAVSLPFDLEAGPLLRAQLVKLSEQSHLLLLNVHHSVFDGWSVSIFQRELTALYGAMAKPLLRSIAQKQPLDLPELLIQYDDFACWQQQHLAHDSMRAQLDYWREQLSGPLPVLALPTDYPENDSPGSVDMAGASHTERLPKGLSDRIKALSQQTGVTLFMLLLAAFQTLLYRYSGQSDVIVGTPIAGRDRVELEPLIGLFINNLALRTSFEDSPTFVELLHQVRATTLEAYAHQSLPFEKLVEAIQPERIYGQTPIFQTLFQLRNLPDEVSTAAGLTIESVKLVQPTARFDLTLDVVERDGELCCQFQYRTARFAADTIARMGRHFRTLLESVVADTYQPVNQLTLLGEPDYRQLSNWKKTDTTYPIDRCIHQLFEAQVLRSPEAIAVACNGKQLTYQALNQRANQLAAHLKTLNVGPENCVGLCIERSAEMIVGLLGILKAGGAYVPIDPQHPHNRRTFILSDANVAALLTSGQLLSEFEMSATEAADYPIILLDTPDDWAEPWNTGSNVESEVEPGNLAYVIYTSGSTGKPKGVMVEHHSVVNLAHGLQQAIPDADASMSVSVNGSLAFDTSVKQIVQLLYGHRLEIIPDGLRFDGQALLDYLKRQNIHRLDCTPSQLRLLLSAGLLKQETPLKQVLVGGEPIDTALWQTLANGSDTSSICFYNVYGPTECTVDTTVAPIQGETPHIGRPIVNTAVCVVAPEGEALQPTGALGELCVSGAGVARGYLNQADLTQEKFVPLPLELANHVPARTADNRLYRTGDLGRCRADGTLEYAGRIDQQVKIRGFRVELGEIEAVISRQPHVQTSAVVLRENEQKDELTLQRLVAYVVAQKDNKKDNKKNNKKDSRRDDKTGGRIAIAPETLRSAIASQLPDYMVPSAFVFLDALPLTTNGKLNKQALPAPDPDQRLTSGVLVSPRNAVEREIKTIWQELLQRQQIGVKDNLFELGGHSLLIARIAARLYNRFSIEVSIKTLFERPTIAQTAETIVKMAALDPAMASVDFNQLTANKQSIQPVYPRPEKIPASFTQQRWWFFQQLEPNTSLYNRPRLFRLRADISVESVKQALSKIIARHEVLRTSVKMVDQMLVQTVNENWSLTLPVIALSATTPAEREQVLQNAIDTAVQEKLDLADTLMLTARILDSGTGDGMGDRTLLLVMHHVISDHWTLDLLLNELTILCDNPANTLPNHQTQQLKALPIQYVDFSIYQQQQTQQPAFQAHLDYWKNKLSGNLPILELPTDNPRQKNRAYKGKVVPLKLSKGLTQQLKDLSQKENATLFMTMLAAFQVLLYRYTNQTDLIVGLPVAGRQWQESEQLLGCFLNTIALRTDLAKQPTFSSLLQRVREASLEAFEHQYCPFEKVIEQLNVSRDDKQSPVFNVFFDFINTPHSVAVDDSLPLMPVRVERGTAMFDLTLYLEDKPDGLEILFEYSCALFEPTTIDRMAGHFEQLLSSAVAMPEQSIEQLPMLTEAEGQQLVTDWNQTQTRYPTEPIHRLFEAQVQQTPAAIALTHPTQQHNTQPLADPASQLTYQQLNQRANRLAHYLQSLGVGSGVLVGICFHRSFEMIVSMLAILKAGGAYVPLDPGYPVERLAFMLQDTQLPVLITNSSIDGELWDLFDQCDAKVLTLDNPNKWLVDGPSFDNRENLSEPSPRQNADALAYVVYTSGSTGTPKGVMVPHRAVNRLVCASDYVQVQSGDRIAQASNTSFDAATFEIWGALLNGAQLVIVNKETLLSPQAFSDFLQRQQISILFITTALFNQLADLSPQTFNILRCLLFGGEAVDPKRVRAVLSQGKPQHLLHVYGPTENTTFSTYHEVTAVGDRATTVPIGQPIANTQAYVLDEQQQPVPVGIAGELFLGGAGLALGYLNRPEITARQFVHHPFGNDPNDQLYRTGDLVRYRSNGNLEFVGRIDRQVKIRGFRIELGEIEAAIAQHPQVQNVVVMTVDESNDKRLVGYVIKSQVVNRENLAGVPPDAGELSQFVRQRLPSYMVPAAFVFLSHFPITPNGKIDRKALPAPDFSQQATKRFVAPGTPVEQQLSQIWCNLLPVEKVGIHDSFFELGGHSLLATQVVSRLRSLYSIELPLCALFEAATLEALAQRIETLLWMRSDKTHAANDANDMGAEVEEREEIEF